MRSVHAVLLFLPLAAAASGAHAGMDCACVANGKEYQVGETACLGPPGSPYIARCGWVLNNTSWTRIADGCPAAQTEAGPLPEGKDEGGKQPLGG